MKCKLDLKRMLRDSDSDLFNLQPCSIIYIAEKIVDFVIEADGSAGGQAKRAREKSRALVRSEFD